MYNPVLMRLMWSNDILYRQLNTFCQYFPVLTDGIRSIVGIKSRIHAGIGSGTDASLAGGYKMRNVAITGQSGKLQHFEVIFQWTDHRLLLLPHHILRRPSLHIPHSLLHHPLLPGRQSRRHHQTEVC